VAGGCVDTFVAERLLSLANVARGQLGTDEAAEIVRLDADESSPLGAAHHTPDGAGVRGTVRGSERAGLRPRALMLVKT
jgi:hypothetical protein